MGYRNFVMTTKTGEKLAYANTYWTYLNLEKGVPARLQPEDVEGYGQDEKLDMEYAPRKIVLPDTREKQESFVVQKHHLDTNHHVNNQQFIDIAMDFLPEVFCVGQVRAEYRKQAFLNDILVPCVINGGERVIVMLEDESNVPYMIAEFREKETI